MIQTLVSLTEVKATHRGVIQTSLSKVNVILTVVLFRLQCLTKVKVPLTEGSWPVRVALHVSAIRCGKVRTPVLLFTRLQYPPYH